MRRVAPSDGGDIEISRGTRCRLSTVREVRVPEQAAVRREVWQRDRGRCAFIGRTGRCEETEFLEFHHVAPYAAGGEATTDNIQLRCRAHDQYVSRLFFGDMFVRERPPAWITEPGYGSSNGGADGVSSSLPWETGRPSMISRARGASEAATTTLYWESSREGTSR